jgi:hypothetical protein
MNSLLQTLLTFTVKIDSEWDVFLLVQDEQEFYPTCYMPTCGDFTHICFTSNLLYLSSLIVNVMSSCWYKMGQGFYLLTTCGDFPHFYCLPEIQKLICIEEIDYFFWQKQIKMANIEK